MKEIAKQLQIALDEMEAAKYHTLARESVLNFPEANKLGHESVYLECAACGRGPEEYLDAINIMDTRLCVRCDDIGRDK